MRLSLSVFVLVCSAFFAGIGSTAQGAVEDVNQAGSQLQPTTRPGMIYVADFAIDAAAVKEQDGVLGRRELLPGSLLRRRVLPGRRENPAETAARLVELLSESIAQRLNGQGFPAMRLPPGQQASNSGWLVRGQFLEVDQGNRLRRAVIGFGAGESDMQIAVEVYNLASHADVPFLTFGAATDSGKKPGAIVTMNPYVAAAKFVLSKNASEKDVRHAGEQIATEIIKYIKARGLTAAP